MRSHFALDGEEARSRRTSPERNKIPHHSYSNGDRVSGKTRASSEEAARRMEGRRMDEPTRRMRDTDKSIFRHRPSAEIFR